MILKYKGTKSTSTLTEGKLYDAKVEDAASGKVLRVYNDNGRWSKYGGNGFEIVEITPKEYDEVRKMPHSKPWVNYRLSDMLAMEKDPHKRLSLKEIEPSYVAPTPHTHTFSDATIKRAEIEMAKEIRGLLKEKPLDRKTIEELVREVKKAEEKIEESKPVKKMTLRSFLEGQGVPTSMIDKLAEFRNAHKVEDSVKDRVEMPSTLYQGGAIWTACIAAILQGQNILLQGAKATGKNVLANNLAFFFGRPLWDISFHVNMDAGSLIGSDTFKNNEVQFRPGSVYNCAVFGGFGVLDEVNMAKNEAMAVLHSVTDDRRVIDVPGYERLKLNEATRFIATMNFGYAGTRELNEAFASRFVVIHVPQLNEKELIKLLQGKVPNAVPEMLKYYAGVFNDLQKKAENAEISTKAVDLRGMISALKMTEIGMSPFEAMEVNVINKCFDSYERDIVRDVVKTRISSSWTYLDIFDGSKLHVDFSGVR